MAQYNTLYKKYIDDKNAIPYSKIERGKFYIIKEYNYADSHKEKYSDINAPIIYTLFVSKSKNTLHAIKVSNINPNVIKKFFGKFVNQNHTDISIPGKSKQFYQSVVSKVPAITSDAYRSYKLDGIKKVLELTIDEEGILFKKTIKEIK